MTFKAGQLFLNLLNKLVFSAVLTLSIYTESQYVKYSASNLFFVFIAIASFLLAFIFDSPVKGYFESGLKEMDSKKKWSPTMLGPFRGFEPLKINVGEKRYFFESDLAYLAFSVVIFWGTYLFITFLGKQGFVKTSDLDIGIFITAFILFFSYSLVLLGSYLLYYEDYLAEKKGRPGLSSSTFYAYIFFMLISLGVLVGALYRTFTTIF